MGLKDKISREELEIEGVTCPFCADTGKKLKSRFSSLLYCPKCSGGWFP